MRKIWTRLTALIAPFWSIANSLSSIARDLQILRELHELDLSSRHPPVWRIAERPSPADTEIFYSSDPPPRPDPFDSEGDEGNEREEAISHFSHLKFEIDLVVFCDLSGVIPTV